MMKDEIRSKLRTILVGLAEALTGKTPQENSLTPLHIHAVIAGEEFYLPDGGYSRLIVSIETGRARLTSNSLERPKQAWKNCTKWVTELETAVAEARGPDSSYDG